MAEMTRAEVRFDCHGRAVGKMRNELTGRMVLPFEEGPFEMATDEGSFHGGDATAPPPLSLFVGALTGCIMTQIRAFAKRLEVDLASLEVEARAVWDWEAKGRVYETAPRSFEIDVMIDSPAAESEIRALIDAAKRGCFIEQTLGRENVIRHRFRRDGAWVEA